MEWLFAVKVIYIHYLQREEKHIFSKNASSSTLNQDLHRECTDILVASLAGCISSLLIVGF